MRLRAAAVLLASACIPFEETRALVCDAGTFVCGAGGGASGGAPTAGGGAGSTGGGSAGSAGGTAGGSAGGAAADELVLTLNLPAQAFAEVRRAEDGRACSAAVCRFPLDGGPVTLTAHASRGGSFTGWSGACAGPFPTCKLGPTASAQVTADFVRANLVFVTRQTVPVEQLGATAPEARVTADAVCADAASDAGLSGAFRAWISYASSSSGVTYDPGLAVTGRGWVRGDGRLVARTRAELNRPPWFPVLFDEHGEPADGGVVATGTLSSGVASGRDCGGWRPGDGGLVFTAGVVTGGGVAWTNRFDVPCADAGARLYCVETGRDAGLTAPVEPGPTRAVFLSTGTLAPSASFAAQANARCASEGMRYLRPTAQFSALLDSFAASQLDPTGAPWVDDRGVRVFAPGPISTAAAFELPPYLTPDASVPSYISFPLVWTSATQQLGHATSTTEWFQTTLTSTGTPSLPVWCFER